MSGIKMPPTPLAPGWRGTPPAPPVRPPALSSLPARGMGPRSGWGVSVSDWGHKGDSWRESGGAGVVLNLWRRWGQKEKPPPRPSAGRRVRGDRPHACPQEFAPSWRLARGFRGGSPWGSGPSRGGCAEGSGWGGLPGNGEGWGRPGAWPGPVLCRWPVPERPAGPTWRWGFLPPWRAWRRNGV